MIKTSTRSSTKTPMASKSRLPLPQKYSKKSVPTPGSCPKARPAPNFNKIHKDWQDKFETGRVSGKKPCTVPREFEVTRPGTRFTHNGDSDGESLPDFEADQLALETILNDHGVGQNRITGRATVATEKPSAGKMKRSRSAHSIGKRRVFGELACDPEQKQNGRRRSRSAKKALEFSKEFQKSAESEFQPDNQAMESILNETGISVTDNKDQGRFTYAGPAATAGPTQQIRQSLYYVPQTDRMSMAKAMTAYQNLLLSKLDSKGAKLQTPTDESVNNVLDRYNHSQQMPKVVQSPFGRTVAAPIRNSIYKSYQIQSNLRSPHPNAPTDKEEMADVNSRTPKRVMTREAQGSSRRAPYSCKSSSKKNVKWADVLNDETSCDVPVAFKKEKVSKKSLFQPLSANDTFVDDYKENSVPGGGEARPEGRGHSDRRDHANGDDATTALQHYSGTAAGDESSQTAATESSPSSVAELAVLSMTHPASLCTSQASTAPRTRHPTQACSTGHGHTSAHLAPPPPSHAQLTTPGITRNQDFYKTFNHGSQDVKGLAKVPCVVPCGPVNPYPGTTAWTGYGDSAANTNRQQLQAIGEKVQLERKIEQKEMAMHTDETEDGQTPQQGETTATEHVTGTTDTQDRVSRFVGHVKRTRKRQSIAELNESISESHVHLQRLEGEITRLQYDGQEEIHQGSGTQETTNIIYHLEMIRKQQEQLVLLEQQLQEQLTGRGHSVTQGQNRTSSECDSLNGNNASKESVARSQGHLTSQGQSTVFSDTMVYSGFENNNVIVNPADIPVSVTSQYTHTDCDTTKQPSSEHRMAPNMGPWMSPIFTPQNQRVAAQSHRAPPSQIITEMSTVSVCGTTPTVRECGAELPCPIDLSHGSRSAVCDSPYQGETLDNLSMPQSPYRTAFCPTTPSMGNTNSAFTSVSGSPLGLGSPFRSLSLKASVMSSPARSSPLRMMRRDEESLLRKVSVRTNERYLEALLDDECALYAYRLQTLRSEEENRMDISNPVARVLSEGDDMHFVPIMEEGPHAISLRENSAFCCYAR